MAVSFAQAERGGAYRFRGVSPGEYFVRAYASAGLLPSQKDAPLSYVSTLFPDATDVAFARPIVLGSGQELGGVDFALATSRRRSVTGRLVDPAGASLANARVNLMPHTTGTLEKLETSAAADGTFRFADVPAGDYMVTVFDMSDKRSWNTAVHDVSVFEDVTGLQLVAGPSPSTTGGRPRRFHCRSDG